MNVITLPAYKVKEDKKGWYIEKPDGKHVNNWHWIFENEAKAYLNRLIKMGYCK